MQATIRGLELVMWEKVDMPDSVYNKEKKAFEKTGKFIERTSYTFRDEFGDKIVFFGDNNYREYERQGVDIDVKLSYDDYNRKIKVSLASVRKAE